MTRYRARAVLLLFLLLHLTGCATTTGPRVVPLQPTDVDQFDLILVTKSDGTQLEVENPSVEGDELVGTARASQLGLAEVHGRVPISVLLADVETIEAVDGAATSYVLGEKGTLALKGVAIVAGAALLLVLVILAAVETGAGM
mgnify:FL=1